MAGQIFISYRREDAQGTAGRLYDALRSKFPADRLFLDVDGIPPGEDFVDFLDQKVAQSEALLAVIGPRWSEAGAPDGTRRLDDPQDFVRIEIESAIARGVKIVPVLVDGAQMPRADELPDGMRALARRNAVTLTHNRFNRDVEDLTAALGARRGQSRQSPTAFWKTRFAYGAVMGLLAAITFGVGMWVDTNVAWEDEYAVFFGYLALVGAPAATLTTLLRLIALSGAGAWRWILLAPFAALQLVAVYWFGTPRGFLTDADVAILLGTGGVAALAALIAFAVGRPR